MASFPPGGHRRRGGPAGAAGGRRPPRPERCLPAVTDAAGRGRGLSAGRAHFRGGAPRMRSRRPGSLDRPGKAEARKAGFRLRVAVPWRGARRREAARTGSGSGEGRATRRRRSRTTRGGLRRRRSGSPGTRTGWTSGCSCWWTWCCSWSCTCGRDGLPAIYIQKLTPGLNSEHDLQLLEQRQDCATGELQTLKGPSFLFHIPYSLGD